MYRSTRLPILRHFQAAQRARQPKARHDRMVALVDRMLDLNKRRGGLRPPAARNQVAAAFRPPREGVCLKADATQLDREIAATDAQIDELVYELYGITDEERKIIEGKT